MPTFGYPDTSEKFQDNLDLLEVIIQKYYIVVGLYISFGFGICLDQ
jgi:hypothetical protein